MADTVEAPISTHFDSSVHIEQRLSTVEVQAGRPDTESLRRDTDSIVQLMIPVEQLTPVERKMVEKSGNFILKSEAVQNVLENLDTIDSPEALEEALKAKADQEAAGPMPPQVLFERMDKLADRQKAFVKKKFQRKINPDTVRAMLLSERKSNKPSNANNLRSSNVRSEDSSVADQQLATPPVNLKLYLTMGAVLLIIGLIKTLVFI